MSLFSMACSEEKLMNANDDFNVCYGHSNNEGLIVYSSYGHNEFGSYFKQFYYDSCALKWINERNFEIEMNASEGFSHQKINLIYSHDKLIARLLNVNDIEPLNERLDTIGSGDLVLDTISRTIGIHLEYILSNQNTTNPSDYKASYYISGSLKYEIKDEGF
jgi:hypothetical protein